MLHEPEPLGAARNRTRDRGPDTARGCCIKLQASAQSTYQKISVVSDTCALARNLSVTRSSFTATESSRAMRAIRVVTAERIVIVRAAAPSTTGGTT
jgi:hypothetical protein